MVQIFRFHGNFRRLLKMRGISEFFVLRIQFRSSFRSRNERRNNERRFICFMRDIKISAKLGNPIVFRPVRFHEELMGVSFQTKVG